LAWSGHGAITRVDVTLDGGENWFRARLANPGETKALTRFYLDIDWNGKDMFCKAEHMMRQDMCNRPRSSLEMCVVLIQFIIITVFKRGG
jgi:hypothetical protein